MSELSLSDPYLGAHPIITEFVLPMVRGETVTIGGPARGEDISALIADIITNDRANQYLQLEIQRRTARLLSQPPLVELRPSDIKLTIAAYQVCWFFHSAVEEGKVWESRQRNVLDATLAMHCKALPPPAQRDAS